MKDSLGLWANLSPTRPRSCGETSSMDFFSDVTFSKSPRFSNGNVVFGIEKVKDDPINNFRIH